MAKQKISYEEAMQQLQAIVTKVENGEMNLDELTQQLKKAKDLIATCKEMLYKTDEEVQKLLDEDEN